MFSLCSNEFWKKNIHTEMIISISSMINEVITIAKWIRSVYEFTHGELLINVWD